MEFRPTRVDGVVLIESRAHRDERGSFERAFCRSTFAAAGIDFVVRQASISTSVAAGTLRGLHYQRATHPEAKVVRCIAGRVFDVVVDLRPQSRTYRSWHGVELSAGTGLSMYIPSGVAHGFLSRQDDSVVHYMMDADYERAAGTGVRWNDPAFGIDWPANPTVMSLRDSSYPNFES